MTVRLARPISLGVLLESATDPLPGTGCRLWSLALDSDGYGRVRHHGRAVRVARLVMAWSYGYELDEVPPHVVTRHRCHERRCIEPSHLVAGYNRDNVRDAVRAGRHTRAFVDGSCPRGHDITNPANVKVCRDGERRCRACIREHERRNRQRARTGRQQ